MRRSRLFLVAILCFTTTGYAQNYSYLFVWSGDDAKKDADFLVIIDAEPKSPHYGQAVASVAVPGPGGTPHHTELDMPRDGMLLANAFESGRTMLLRPTATTTPVVGNVVWRSRRVHASAHLRAAIERCHVGDLPSITVGTDPSPMAGDWWISMNAGV
jgi:hypothetical protein